VKSYVLSALAEQDLADIWDYIAHDNIVAADRVVIKIRQEVRKLAEMPGMGHHRPDLPDPALRAWKVYSYLIVYNAEKDPLEVVRIIHGMRDIPDIFHR
jgi:toxin ParE1/3/4